MNRPSISHAVRARTRFEPSNNSLTIWLNPKLPPLNDGFGIRRGRGYIRSPILDNFGPPIFFMLLYMLYIYIKLVGKFLINIRAKLKWKPKVKCSKNGRKKCMKGSFVTLYKWRQKIECTWTKEECENQFPGRKKRKKSESVRIGRFIGSRQWAYNTVSCTVRTIKLSIGLPASPKSWFSIWWAI